MTLEQFAEKVKDFTDLSSSEQIVYFVYFLTVLEMKGWTQPKEVASCFDSLSLPQYSNISAFLSRKSTKKAGQLFIFNKKLGYSLIANQKSMISAMMGEKKIPKPSNDLLDLSRFEGVRGYIKFIAEEINLCYDNTAYTACSVLLRRLIETLIIEAYERKGLESKIKDVNNDYFMFAGLVQAYTKELALSPSRGIKKNLPNIKYLGDNAAHNKKFIATKKDIDELKKEILMTITELLFTIDYPNWK